MVKLNERHSVAIKINLFGAIENHFLENINEININKRKPNKILYVKANMIISLLEHLYFVNSTEVGNRTVLIGVCPNSAYNKLNLLIMEKFKVIVYELYNEKQTVLKVKAFHAKEESIDLIKYKGKNFILKVYDDRKLLKSFQIQKLF